MLWMTLVHGSLSEQFCIWRTMIHRYSSDDGQYLYNVENSEYGIPVAAGLSYKYELFSVLNDYIYDINKSLDFTLADLSITLKTRRFFSDIHFTRTKTNKIRLFNPNYKCNHPNLPKLYFNIYTNNIIMLYNIFHVTLTPVDVFNKVFNKKHIFLENWINFI